MTLLQRVHALSQHQTIAAIYETVIRSELCDFFLKPTENEISRPAETIQPPQLQKPGADLDLALHFARAVEILEQQWSRSGRPKPAQFFEGGDNFWILLDVDGKVSRASRVARAFLQKDDVDVLTALDLSLNGQARVKRRLSQLGLPAHGRNGPEVLLRLDGARRLLCRSVSSGYGLQASFGVMIEALDFEWTKRARDMLAATFGLHLQELELLGSIFEGESLEDLAMTTHGGLVGLEVQLQMIIAKTGAPGLAEMLRLFCFLIDELATDDRIASGVEPPPEGRLVRSSNHPLQFYKIGADTGQPVIFLHGLLDGIAGVQRLQSQFRKRGFRVYAPLRCGYGCSGPTPTPERSFDIFIDQLEGLLEQENLQRPILLGHRGGSSFAHIAARRLRDRVAGAVIVSGMGPTQNLRELSSLTGHLRMMALTASYSPKIMPLVVKHWARSIRQNGLMTLARSQPGIDGDANDLLESPTMTALLQSSHDMSLMQQCTGLMADFHWIVNDWRRHIDGPTAPVIYLHGEGDQVTSTERLQRAMIGRSNVQVRLCHGGGGLLLYTRPELVFSALEELADR